jgi:hypothetical protein
MVEPRDFLAKELNWREEELSYRGRVGAIRWWFFTFAWWLAAIEDQETL